MRSIITIASIFLLLTLGSQANSFELGSAVLGEKLSNFKKGDVVLGDKNAKIRIIEYSSLTCHHCAHFHTHILEKLK